MIELLIVIAIILILISIALPNFLEAQIRAKVVQAAGNGRSIGIAMEEYRIDFGFYPTDHDPDDPSQKGLYQLTSPIEYISAVPQEPFARDSGLLGPNDELGWEMASTGPNKIAAAVGLLPKINAFGLASFGPDLRDHFPCGDRWTICVGPGIDPCSTGDGAAWTDYAPTNGTKSIGDIMTLGGDLTSGNYCVNGWKRVSGFSQGPT
ncbi:MAG: hypothetical protein KC978_01030 [Candidatus Omnitrophica bacterium]|nr:hypothetical protein [Candidatus Omnitrophota bacterium]